MSPLPYLIEQRCLASIALAAIVRQLFPHVVLKEGGLHSLGFYYDFIFEKPLTNSMLELIEVHLHRFIKEARPVRSISMMRENAQNLFEHQEHFLLAEWAGEQKTNILDLIQIEDVYGLSPPIALTSTQEIGPIKLLGFKETHPVTRVLGTVQKSAKDLKHFLKTYDSFLKKRDHRLLGPKLNLFSFLGEMGDLGVIWHSKGLELQHILLNWLKQQLPEESHISTPLALRQAFLEQTDQALESFVFEGEEYQLRSSLVRQHLAFLKQFPLESRAFPWRVTECTSIFRQYSEPQWWGLFCCCAYQTVHTTICCLQEQVLSEIISSLHFIEKTITIFDFEAKWYLIASQQKGPKARQEQEAVRWLKQAIDAFPRVYPYSPDLQEEGENPRLELRVRDVLGREWSVSGLSVIPALSAQPAEEQKRVVLTRQIWDSLDRLIALLIERYEGNLPFWLAPEQVRVLAIGEANDAYAQQVCGRLRESGCRVKLDTRQAKLSLRVHEAEKEKVPYLVLIGENERLKQKISVRAAGEFNQNPCVDIEMFLTRILRRK